MAFKLNATVTSGNIINKQYLYMAIDTGSFGRVWHYVTADAPALVESHGYFDADDGADSAQAVANLRVGDRIVVYQVAAIADTRTLDADAAAGLTDVSEHIVLTNDGVAVDLSSDILGATLTYTV